MNEEKKRPEDAEPAQKKTEDPSDEKATQGSEKDPFRVRPLHADNDESGGH